MITTNLSWTSAAASQQVSACVHSDEIHVTMLHLTWSDVSCHDTMSGGEPGVIILTNTNAKLSWD